MPLPCAAPSTWAPATTSRIFTEKEGRSTRTIAGECLEGLRLAAERIRFRSAHRRACRKGRHGPPGVQVQERLPRRRYDPVRLSARCDRPAGPHRHDAPSLQGGPGTGKEGIDACQKSAGSAYRWVITAAVTDGPDASEAWAELTAEGVTIYDCWEDPGQGGDVGTMITAHETLRPLAIPPEKIRLVMNDMSLAPNSGPSGASRQQVVTGQAIKAACEQLVKAMRKPDGSYRTYEEMTAENIPTKYVGQHTTRMARPPT